MESQLGTNTRDLQLLGGGYRYGALGTFADFGCSHVLVEFNFALGRYNKSIVSRRLDSMKDECFVKESAKPEVNM
jgi:hypothetical protein